MLSRSACHRVTPRSAAPQTMRHCLRQNLSLRCLSASTEHVNQQSHSQCCSTEAKATTRVSKPGRFFPNPAGFFQTRVSGFSSCSCQTRGPGIPGLANGFTKRYSRLRRLLQMTVCSGCSEPDCRCICLIRSAYYVIPAKQQRSAEHAIIVSGWRHRLTAII